MGSLSDGLLPLITHNYHRPTPDSPDATRIPTLNRFVCFATSVIGRSREPKVLYTFLWLSEGGVN